MEKEHKNLRQLVNNLNCTKDYNVLTDFANALNDHIRFEERTLFPQYESSFTESELAEIGEKIREYSHEFSDNYEDEFWK